MKRLIQLYRSVVGRKIIAALTGTVLLGFLVLHAFGNLNNFAGVNADGVPAINAYAGYLRDAGTPLVPQSLLLWCIRVLLIAAFILHIHAVVSLAHLNHIARGTSYKKRRYRHSSLAARSVLISGFLLMLFIVTHVTQFAFGALTPFRFIHDNVYHNLYSAFQQGWLVGIYLVSLLALGFHLHHGIWSLFQTLGLDNPDRNAVLRWTTSITTVGLITLFASIPLAFYSGLLPPLGATP